MNTLRLNDDPVSLTQALIDIPSPSHSEAAIADTIYQALLPLKESPGVEVLRHGNTIVARTHRGLGSRVILAGHVDTVPIADNVPSTRRVVPAADQGGSAPITAPASQAEAASQNAPAPQADAASQADAAGTDTIFGCGAVDMKSGLAVYMHTFAALAADPALTRDLTFIAYEGEEVSTQFNGLGHLQEHHPDWLEGDFALLGEPSNGVVEAGCQGSIRLKVTGHGERAHSARAWLGSNAIHVLAPVIGRIAAYTPQNVTIDDLEYREGLNIVRIQAGVANNTIPDEAWFFVNFRYAPHRSVEEALAHLREVLAVEELERSGAISIELDDVAPAAAPGLASAVAQQLVSAVGGRVYPKFGWTDVARFAQMGIPAVNLGAGDPAYAHKKDEQCPVSQITQLSQVLNSFLTSPADED